MTATGAIAAGFARIDPLDRFFPFCFASENRRLSEAVANFDRAPPASSVC